MSDGIDKLTTGETRIVIAHKGNGATIGVQRTNCDPLFFTAEGELATVLNAVPGFVEEAGRRWQTNPRYPKAELPAPPPPAATVTPQQGTQPRQQANDQHSMF